MKCPRCFKDNTTLVNNDHYICNDPSCVDDNGNRTEFSKKIDDKIKFPYNQIFITRKKEEFYRKPYYYIK